ncbi:hypothetical protein J7E73_24050 [Paenibacillus albidus]|nr:hypothetical protein [Paenibacillus albidus]
MDAYDGHGGGDQQLISNYLKVIRGEEKSATPLDDGLLSALLCLKANESAEKGSFCNIAWD